MSVCTTILHSLGRLGGTLLDNSSSDAALTQACGELYALLSEAAQLHDPWTTETDTSLLHGYALQPTAAARCLLDVKRTVAFLRGLWAAIVEMRRRLGPEPMEIVYAGTGPFATLALPLLPLLPQEPFAFTFIDVHADALSMLQRSVERLHVDVETRFVHADAVRYTHPMQIHIALTETMQQALTKEPFVSVVSNLRQQLHSQGFLIPERVAISAAMIDPECLMQGWTGTDKRPRELGQLLEVTRDRPISFDPITLEVPDLGDRKHLLGLMTRIDVFGGYRVEQYDSGLTTPRMIWPLSPLHSGDVLEFTYAVGTSPDFVARRTRRHGSPL